MGFENLRVEAGNFNEGGSNGRILKGWGQRAAKEKTLFGGLVRNGRDIAICLSLSLARRN